MSDEPEKRDEREPTAESATAREGPLGDLAADVDRRRERQEDVGGLFESEDVGEIDHDVLWERVEADEDAIDADPDAREIRQIPKEKYCHRCEHFSKPPTLECTHEGTDILELVDVETFRVADCPVVLRDEELERSR